MLQRIQLRNGEWIDFKAAVPQFIKLPYSGTIREDKYKANDYWSSKLSGWAHIPIKAFTTYRSKQLGGGLITVKTVEDDAFILIAKLADPFCNFDPRARVISTEPSEEIAAAIGQRVFFNDTTQQKETSEPRVPLIMRPSWTDDTGKSQPRRATLCVSNGQPTPPTPTRRPVTVKPAEPTPAEVVVDDFSDNKRVQSALANMAKAQARLDKAIEAAKKKAKPAPKPEPTPEPIAEAPKSPEALSREEVIRNCKSLGMSDTEIQAFMGEK